MLLLEQYFLKKNKPVHDEDGLSSISNVKSLTEIDKRLSDIFPEFLSEFADPKKFDKKLRALKKDIDKEIKL